MANPITKIVEEEDNAIRLDKWFARNAPDFPFGLLQKLLRKGAVRLDGEKAKTSTRIATGQAISYPVIEERERTKPEKQKQTATLEQAEHFVLSNVLYKDDDILIINKPAGMPAQGGSKVKLSIDAMLPHACFEKKTAPKLVHRIDKDTSGILVLARTTAAASELGKMFKEKRIQKTYWAVVVGVPKDPEATIKYPLVGKKQEGKIEKAAIDIENGKPAVTEYKVLERAARTLSWVELKPITGRMHQLRVHMQAIGHPILGDGKYGGKEAFIHGLSNNMHLHARHIQFRFKGKKISATASLPKHMQGTFDKFEFQA